MENSLEEKNHPCKNCIISMICTEPCERYQPSICVLNTLPEYHRAINYAKNITNTIFIRINLARYIEITDHIEYFKNGKLHHNEDKPALIHADGTLKYYKNGRLHRDGDKPAVVHIDGYKEYWKNGNFIRADYSSM